MDAMASRLLREFQIALDELIERELLLDANPLAALETHSHTTLSWSSGAHLSYLFGEYQRLPDYQAILDGRDFSMCMLDGGLLQIRYDVAGEQIIQHCLSYFPCPFTFTDEERQGFALSELPSLFGADELKARVKLTSPIRFDYNAERSDERHAHSHVSFNKETCRMPAYGPLSLGHFFRFVLRYFYETEFTDLAAWEEVQPRLYYRTLPYPPPHEFHWDTAAPY
jgi:hypothetical protein